LPPEIVIPAALFVIRLQLDSRLRSAEFSRLEGAYMNVADSEIKSLLTQYKKIAVYGLSPDVRKASHYVPLYMRDHGWSVVGTYPKPHSENEFRIYSSLKDIPVEDRRFVDVFRSSDRIPEVVDEVLAVGGVEVLWLQLGISHPEAELRAEQAGLKVISDRCLIIEHKRFFKS
jgi:predicted CoA-binding protein